MQRLRCSSCIKKEKPPITAQATEEEEGEHSSKKDLYALLNIFVLTSFSVLDVTSLKEQLLNKFEC
eukprot:m.60660 g.60660  ORF g.60660 m.60660 type:complete len:66 (+) comp34941_c0_seq5:345-542(+)